MLMGFFTVLGGLSLFLLGMDVCRQGFQSVGGWLHRALFKLARGRFKPFLFGTALTLLSQNSTIATSLAISFVDIGTMNLTEAILAMSGASFGGGIVIFLISLDIVKAGPLLLFISILFIRLSNSSEGRTYGRILEGIALIFLGMTTIQTGVVPIVENPEVRSLILWSSTNFLLSALVAFLLTSIIQNNTAVVAIAISIAEAGLITPLSGMAIVIGAHIGSTTLVLISGMTGKLNARRLGLATVVYKLLGAIITLAFIPFMPALVHRYNLPVSSFLVLFQLLLATVNAVTLTPFSRQLRRLAETLAPLRHNPGEPIYLNPELQNVPAIALKLLSRELMRLSNFLEAYFQILFSHPEERHRLPKLQKDMASLFRECQTYFSGIPIPEEAFSLKRRYYNLSIMLSSLEIMTAGNHLKFVRVWLPSFLERDYLREINPNFIQLLRYAFRLFVLGDGDLAKTGQRFVNRYKALEYKLRCSVILNYERQNIEDSRELIRALAILSRIVYAAEHILEDLRLDEAESEGHPDLPQEEANS